MDKILNYIKSGKGIGLLFLLAASVLCAIFFVLEFKQFYADIQPKIMMVAEDFLPVKFQNSQIVDPLGIYKKVDMNLAGSENEKDIFSIVLDTREEVSQMPQDQGNGVFIMRDSFYVISPRGIEKRSYHNLNEEINKEGFAQYLDYFSGMISFIGSLVVISILFTIMLIMTVIVSFVASFGLKIMHKDELYDFSALMRLSAIVVAVVRILTIISGMEVLFEFLLSCFFVLSFLFMQVRQQKID